MRDHRMRDAFSAMKEKAERAPQRSMPTIRDSLHKRLTLALLIGLFWALSGGVTLVSAQAQTATPAIPASTNQAFSSASHLFGIPIELLKAICYKEGRLSQNADQASVDQSFGCMGLVKNSAGDTLDQAAQDLQVSVSQLQQNLNTSIFGGAAVLRDTAYQLSGNQTLPTSLADWYSVVAQYSSMRLQTTALMYADAVYTLLKQGFSAQASSGETVTLAPQAIIPNTASATKIHTASSLPGGCTRDGHGDYPGAIDCILSPTSAYDCNLAVPAVDCSYNSSARPASCTTEPVVVQPCNIGQVVIHDTEGSLTSALDVFQCPGTGVGARPPDPVTGERCNDSSVQYIVDTDGSIYQVLREQDSAFHVGNYWYNEHSIGIEHVGFDATGYQWYTPAEYAASARLTAYLLKKYHLPLDRAHVVAHGTVPSPFLAAAPNHIDPGPYWLWDYYFTLISLRGVPFNPATPEHTITLRPLTDRFPEGPGLMASASQYNFFLLYNGPSTASGLIPHEGVNDPTDTSDTVEAEISYYYLQKLRDPAGSGDTLYEIWYGVENQTHATPSDFTAHAQLAWLAVPPGDGVEGQGRDFTNSKALLIAPGGTAQIYGRPTSSSTYVIGDAPAGAIFTTAYSVIEDNAALRWYEINYNHRQAWVPASEIAVQP